MAFRAPLSLSSFESALSTVSRARALESQSSRSTKYLPPANVTQSRLHHTNMSQSTHRFLRSSISSLSRRPLSFESKPHTVLPRPAFRSLSSRPCLTTCMNQPKPSVSRPTSRNGQTYSLQQYRTLFGSSGSQARLASMERNANNSPQNAASQYVFYQALLRAKMPEILVERYESGHYATSDIIRGQYEEALEQLGRAAKVSGVSETGQVQGAANLSPDQLQAIGQAAISRSHGSTIASRNTSQPLGIGGKSSPVHVVVEESLKVTIFKWVRFLLTLAVMLYIFAIGLAFALDTFTSMNRMGPRSANEAKPEHQTVKFSDVHGCEEAKEELQELVEFLKNPDRFSTLGGKLPRGVLLVGPPGTGKTLLARAVAGEAGVPFFFASGSEFDEVFVGVGAKRIRDLFTAARGKAPSIIFIDELDAVGGKRNEKDMAYSKQTLNQLLTEMDGFAKDSNVVVIAATNLPKLLDGALTRPGRFDRKVMVSLPDVRGRLAILKHHIKGIRIAESVDISKIARSTTGFSGADLENLVNQAAVHAGKNKSTRVNLEDLEWAKDKIQMGAEKRSMVIQPKDRLVTAYHEAGHTLMALYTAGANPLYKVTIMPRGHALGITYQIPEMDVVSQTKKQMHALIDVYMGGKVAEELIYGRENVSSGASSDLQGATNVAYKMVAAFGMSDRIGQMNLMQKRVSSQALALVEAEVRRLLNEGYQRASKLLTERRSELETVAQGLLEYETLTKEEVEKLIRGEKLVGKMKANPNAPVKLPERIGEGGGNEGGQGQPIPGAPSPTPRPDWEGQPGSAGSGVTPAAADQGSG